MIMMLGWCSRISHRTLSSPGRHALGSAPHRVEQRIHVHAV
jgi:hypothetical protein